MTRANTRSSTACTNCRQKKRRCDNGTPCATCERRRIPCVYSTQPDGRSRRPTRTQSVPHSDQHQVLDDRVQQQSVVPLGHSETSTPPSVERSGSGVRGVIAERALRQVGALVFRLQPRPDGEFGYRGPASADQQAPFDAENEGQPDSELCDMSWPDKDGLGQHLDLFLEWQSTCILILPKPVIDKICEDYETIRLRRSQNTLLVMAILSLTYMMCPNANTDDHGVKDLSNHFFAEAKRIAFDMALLNPCVQVVQATCILSCREYSRGSEHGAWVLHGLTVTVGNAIGLHAGGEYDRWIKMGYLSQADADTRILAYWTSVLIDRFLALCLGRQSLLHASNFSTPEISVRFPTDRISQSSKWNSTLTLGSDAYEDSIRGAFRSQLGLIKLSHEALSDIYQWRHDFSNLADGPREITTVLQHLSMLVHRHRSRVLSWKEDLPPSMRNTESNPLPHLLLLHMASHNVLILIHRPFLVLKGLQMDGLEEAHEISTSLAKRSSEMCSSSAAEVIRLCGLLREHYTLQCTLFMVAYFVANACTVRLHSMEPARASEDNCHDEVFKEGMELLCEMAETWPVAQRALQAVQRLAAGLENSSRSAAAPVEMSTQVHENSYDPDDLLRYDLGNPLGTQDWAGSWLPMSQSDEWPFVMGTFLPTTGTHSR